jgi:hypothetical protein
MQWPEKSRALNFSSMLEHHPRLDVPPEDVELLRDCVILKVVQGYDSPTIANKAAEIRVYEGKMLLHITPLNLALKILFSTTV